ncbi:MAG TPA: hypothetical protein VGR51_05180 [Thermoplasmata archaeon]|jgi:hypothetical protein|nr:hypothetical protein [Thermoplasmata archaeon]
MSLPPTRDDFTADERAVVERCTTPRRTQRWLGSLRYNDEPQGETIRSFAEVVRAGTAHCLEGALSAATILAHYEYPPLLLDLESADNLDHVAFLFQERGRWGAVAKSREPGLGGRKPVYRSVKALALSFYHPYIDETARITAYGVLDLRTLSRVDWQRSPRNVWKVQDALIAMPHESVEVPKQRYRFWRDRYVRFKARHPDREPTYFPSQGAWL